MRLALLYSLYVKLGLHAHPTSKVELMRARAALAALALLLLHGVGSRPFFSSGLVNLR